MKPGYAMCAALSALMVVVGVGCSSADDLFSEGTPPSGSGDEDDSSGSSNNNNTTSSGNTSNSSSSSSSSTASGGTTSTGGGEGGAGAGESSGAGAGNTGPMLTCGAVSCPVAENSACCWDEFEQHGTPQGECVTGDASSDNCTTGHESSTGYETRIECMSEDHCDGGDVCCGRYGQSQTLMSNVYMSLTCQAENECVYWQNEVIACDDIGGISQCPSFSGPGGTFQTTCVQSTLLPTGYGICTD